MTNFITLINVNGSFISYHVQSVAGNSYLARLVKSSAAEAPQTVNIKLNEGYMNNQLVGKLASAIDSINNAEKNRTEKEVN